MTTERRYDIDWLRVIAIGLLLIYHVSIVFQPWGVFIGFMQSKDPMESLWVPMAMLNVWRIPLLFFVSGMGMCFAMRKRNFKQLIVERTRRILIPFVFGVFVIVPVHVFLWQKYYSQDVVYSPHPGHLWFLGNLFAYVVILSPLFFYLKRNNNGLVNRWLKKLYTNPLGIMAIVVPFVVEVLVVNPRSFELYAMTLHGFILGLVAFFFGFTFILNDHVFKQTILKWKWLYFFIAALMFIVRLTIFDLKAPGFLIAVESNMWILAVMGLAYRYLNRPGRALLYLKQGAYPIYILHMIFIYLGSFLVLPLELKNEVKLLLIIAFTFIGCFVMYDFIVRRIGFIRPLFGIR